MEIKELEQGINNLIIVFTILATVLFIAGIYIGNQLSKPVAIDENKCDCKDVNECEKWCTAKQNFLRLNDYSVTEVCNHPERLTQVLCSAGTCETTVEVCADCREKVSEPKTEC